MSYIRQMEAPPMDGEFASRIKKRIRDMPDLVFTQVFENTGNNLDEMIVQKPSKRVNFFPPMISHLDEFGEIQKEYPIKDLEEQIMHLDKMGKLSPEDRKKNEINGIHCTSAMMQYYEAFNRLNEVKNFYKYRKREKSELEKKMEQRQEQEEVSRTIVTMSEQIQRFMMNLNNELDPKLPETLDERERFEWERRNFREHGFVSFIKIIKLLYLELIEDGEIKESDLGDDYEKLLDQAINGDFITAQKVVFKILKLLPPQEEIHPVRRIVSVIG